MLHADCCKLAADASAAIADEDCVAASRVKQPIIVLRLWQMEANIELPGERNSFD